MSGLISFFPENAFHVVDSVDDWRHAIDIVTAPLTASHRIEARYCTAIKTATQELGPYYVLGAGVAMPHARLEEGVIDTALSMVLVRGGVDFGTGTEKVTILICLAAKDADSHIYAIQALCEILSDGEVINEINNACDALALQEIIKRY